MDDFMTKANDVFPTQTQIENLTLQPNGLNAQRVRATNKRCVPATPVMLARVTGERAPCPTDIIDALEDDLYRGQMDHTAGWSLLIRNALLSSHLTCKVVWFNLHWPLVLSTFFLVSTRHVDPTHAWIALNDRWNVLVLQTDTLQSIQDHRLVQNRFEVLGEMSDTESAFEEPHDNGHPNAGGARQS